MTRRILAVAALTLLAAALLAVVHTSVSQAQTAKVTSVSRETARIGARLTIGGSYFGSRQGTSTVTFGERRVSTPSPTGNQRWAPCAKTARVVSWSRRSITVRVPSMAPGSHKVYVTVGGRSSNSYRFSVDAATVVTGRTFSTASQYGNVMGADNGSGSNLSGYSRNVLFEDCTFEATNPNLVGNEAGVLTLGRATRNYNLTFRNCTFRRNEGAGSGGSGWGGVNGVKSIYGVHDITFEGCTFQRFSRFSIEVWSDNNPANRPYNFAVIDSVFEPSGSQCISWSGGRNRIDSLVDGCIFKGYGTSSERAGGACLEVAGNHHIVTRNSEIWTGSGSALNVNNVPSPCYLYFRNVRIYFDSAHLYQARPPYIYSSVLGCEGMAYSRWSKCHINTGDATICADSAGYTGEDGSPTMWSLTDTHNDFSTSTINGYISHRGVHIPRTAAGYWTSGNGGPHPTNKMPKRVATTP